MNKIGLQPGSPVRPCRFLRLFKRLAAALAVLLLLVVVIGGGWWWWHSKPINRPQGQAPPAVAGMASGKGSSIRSHIPSPIDRWCQDDAAARRQRAE